jgi:excisionase family DNA binding protein
MIFPVSASGDRIPLTMKKPTEEMYTVAQTAEHLKVSKSTVRVWLQRGKFPGAQHRQWDRKLGSYWLIPVSAVKSFKMGTAGRPKKKKSR